MSTQTRAFIRVKLKVARNEKQNNYLGFLFTCKKVEHKPLFSEECTRVGKQFPNCTIFGFLKHAYNIHIDFESQFFWNLIFRKDKSQNLFIFCQCVTATHRPDYMICHFLHLSINICQQYILARYRIHYKIQESIKVQLKLLAIALRTIAIAIAIVAKKAIEYCNMQ